MCADRHGKYMTVPDILTNYIRVDDESEEIFSMWKEPGGKMDLNDPKIIGIRIRGDVI